MDLDRRMFLKIGGTLLGAAAGGWTLRQAQGGSPLLLRPPGAPLEKEFLSRCVRCNQCIQACPKGVLRAAGLDTLLAAGTPYLVAKENPCDLCLGRQHMECLQVCPTDALEKLEQRRDVRMGLAVVDSETCLPFIGISCRACWHACPFPREAITVDNLGRPVVSPQACVGCGLCEYACLAPEPAIRVVPMTAVQQTESHR